MSKMNNFEFDDVVVEPSERPVKLPEPDTTRGKSARTIKKEDLAQILSNGGKMTRSEARHVVDAFFEAIRSSLEGGGHVRLYGFGNFELRKKDQRSGRNPKTGMKIEIAARRVVTFHASERLRARIDEGH
ncbi:hypothetical protein ADM96_26140 [Burkholderia sp. ST111]|nr:hypothetical protein ADM96_26140 [Burkholderia sp. ST111]